jgi:hypothetical protein
MELEASLPCLREPATGPGTLANCPLHTWATYIFNICSGTYYQSNVIFTIFFYEFLNYSVHAKCFSLVEFLHMFILITFDKECGIRSWCWMYEGRPESNATHFFSFTIYFIKTSIMSHRYMNLRLPKPIFQHKIWWSLLLLLYKYLFSCFFLYFSSTTVFSALFLHLKFNSNTYRQI